MEKNEFGYFLGVDWASKKHDVCLTDATGEVLGESVFENSGEGLKALCEWAARLGGTPDVTTVGIEVPHGPVVETLTERGFSVFAVNPKQLDRFRDRFFPSGAKDDRKDALVLASSLRTDRNAFRKLRRDTPELLQLREWSRMRDELVTEQTRLTNQLGAQLGRYYQQILALEAPLSRPWVLELLRMAPTPKAAKKLKMSQLEELCRRHKIRKFKPTELRAKLRERSLQVIEGTVQASSAHVTMLLDRIELTKKQLRDAERQLDLLLNALPDEADSGKGLEQRDIEVLRSLPGVGTAVLTTLLAEASTLLIDRDYRGLRMFLGSAPVTRASGKKRTVLMRRSRNARLAAVMNYWGINAARVDPACKAHYQRLRASGASGPRAVRGVIDRLLAVLCAMLKNGTPYDPKRRFVLANA